MISKCDHAIVAPCAAQNRIEERDFDGRKTPLFDGKQHAFLGIFLLNQGNDHSPVARLRLGWTGLHFSGLRTGLHSGLVVAGQKSEGTGHDGRGVPKKVVQQGAKQS